MNAQLHDQDAIDANREAAIDQAYEDMLAANVRGDADVAKAAFRFMADLIRNRSDAQIKRMERERRLGRAMK